jgi:hypothetical protein
MPPFIVRITVPLVALMVSMSPFLLGLLFLSSGY